MPWAQAVIAFVSVVTLAACSAKPALPVQAEPSSKTLGFADLCNGNEKTLYSCARLPLKVSSMCLGDKSISYRSGNPRVYDVVINSDDNWSNIHLGHVIGGGGGHQTHVRFSTPDGNHYLVLEGAPGQYHDAPDGPWSGVTTVSPTGSEKRDQCEGHAVVAPDWLGLIAKSAPVDPRSLMEEEGSHFDGWF